MGLLNGRPGFDSRHIKSFLFATTSTQAVGTPSPNPDDLPKFESDKYNKRAVMSPVTCFARHTDSLHGLRPPCTWAPREQPYSHRVKLFCHEKISTQ
jgi:hypothetical protein